MRQCGAGRSRTTCGNSVTEPVVAVVRLVVESDANGHGEKLLLSCRNSRPGCSRLASRVGPHRVKRPSGGCDRQRGGVCSGMIVLVASVRRGWAGSLVEIGPMDGVADARGCGRSTLVSASCRPASTKSSIRIRLSQSTRPSSARSTSLPGWPSGRPEIAYAGRPALAQAKPHRAGKDGVEDQEVGDRDPRIGRPAAACGTARSPSSS